MPNGITRLGGRLPTLSPSTCSRSTTLRQGYNIAHCRLALSGRKAIGWKRPSWIAGCLIAIRLALRVLRSVHFLPILLLLLASRWDLGMSRLRFLWLGEMI